MTTPKSILFVCTGNIFRSVAAELCLEKYLLENGIDDWKVASAGIIALPQAIDLQTLHTLTELGIDASKHEQKKLCLGGCEMLINVKSPWGRFDEEGEEAGVCGIECNQTVLNRRTEKMMTRTD